MSKRDKQIQRLLSHPNDYTFSECTTLLKSLGYELFEGSGSRIKFIRYKDEKKIILHRPHPRNEMKQYAIRQVTEQLKINGDL